MKVILPFVFISIAPTFAKSPSCTARCDRLHERSMKRIGFDEEKTLLLMEKQRPLGTMKDVCWRLYDRLDCMKRCPQDKERVKYARDVRFKCKPVLNDLAKDLKCVSRYRSFMQVKCSTFLKEAVATRMAKEPDSVPDRDSCRYLHLNSLCLENSVANYCPSAKKIFRRLNFRDYFLNFIIPEDDFLFDDVDLDSCQIYDFVKSAKRISEQEIEQELTTIINKWEEEETEKWVTPTMTPPKMTTERQEFTTLLNELLTSSESSEDHFTITTISSTEASLENNDASLMTSLNRVTPLETTTSEPSTETSTDRRTEATTPILTTSTEAKEVTETLTETRKTENVEVAFVESMTTESTTANSEELKVTSVKGFTLHLTPPTSTPSTTKVVEDFSEEDANTVRPTTLFRRLFSDDSMEQTPPNFYWSSARFSNSPQLTTPAIDSSSQRDLIVEPVEVDTSTLFGEVDDALVEVTVAEATTITTERPSAIEHLPTQLEATVLPSSEASKTTRILTTLPPTTSVKKETESRIGMVPTVATQKTKQGTSEGAEEATKRTRVVYTPPEQVEESTVPGTDDSTPLLHGGVIVKPIRRYGEPESDEENHASESEKMQRSPIVDQEDLDRLMGKEDEYEYWPSDAKTPKGVPPEYHLSDKEILLFIYLVLFGMALLSLISVLTCCICCRKKNSLNHTKQ